MMCARRRQVRAVGDEGCLGRSCQLSDKASRDDLNSWMDGFLNKGEHAGHKPRDARSRKGMKMGLAQMRDSESRGDLDNFFDHLTARKTHRVLAAEKREAPNPRLSDKADRKELRDFYDNITPKAEGRREGVRKVAEAAGDQKQSETWCGADEKWLLLIADFHSTIRQRTWRRSTTRPARWRRNWSWRR